MKLISRFTQSLIFALLLVQGTQVHSQSLATQPEFINTAGAKEHNSFVFGDVSKQRWVVPYFFESTFECAEPSSFARTVPCRLTVWNRMNQEQESFIRSLKKEGHVDVFFMHDVTPFVSDIQEELVIANESLVPEGAMPQLPHTLSAYPTHPYFTVAMRVPRHKLEETQKAFKEEALGVFLSSFKVQAIYYPEYLRLDLSKEQMRDLARYMGRSLSYDEKIKKVAEWLDAAKLVSSHLNSVESRHIAELFLRKIVFDWKGEMLKESIQGQSIILIEEKRSVNVICSALFPLAEKAKAQITCERE
jgi:hypothetical protein